MIKDYSLLYDLAKSYIASGLVVPKKIAKVILGRISKVTITKTSNQTVKIFEEKCRDRTNYLHSGMPVTIDMEHIYHISNSGHFSGVPASIKHKIDPSPLSVKDLNNIPATIRDPDVISLTGKGHFGDKIKFQKTISQTTTVVVELIKKKDELSILTIYNETSGFNKKELPGS